MPCRRAGLDEGESEFNDGRTNGQQLMFNVHQARRGGPSWVSEDIVVGSIRFSIML